MTRIVWGLGTPRTLRPLWTLEELGLEYEHRKIVSQGSGMEVEEFRELSKRHKIPFYEDERVKIGESASIVTYLADRHGGDVLPIPAPGSAERMILTDRCTVIMTEFDARIYTIRLHDDPPFGLCETYGAAPTAVEAARKYIQNSMFEAARWLKDGRSYMMGEDFGVADILLGSCLVWTAMCNVELPAVLAAYNRRVTSRPGFKAAMKCNLLKTG